MANATNKTDYEFGDLTRWVDARVKDKVSTVTGKGSYEFGDISLWLDSRAKNKVGEFTNKTTYEVGDISKEIFQKVMRGEYKLEDIAFMIKIIVTVGANFTPIGAYLPGKLLIELLDYSLAQELGGRVVSTLTLELDRRVKGAITGDENYQIGDLTKKSILHFINKEEYSFGDITKTVVQNMEEKGGSSDKMSGLRPFLSSAGNDIKSNSHTVNKAKSSNAIIDIEKVEIDDIDPKIIQELLEWDRTLGTIEEKNGAKKQN